MLFVMKDNLKIFFLTWSRPYCYTPLRLASLASTLFSLSRACLDEISGESIGSNPTTYPGLIVITEHLLQIQFRC